MLFPVPVAAIGAAEVAPSPSGKSRRYRSLTLSRFSLAAVREMAIQFEILDPAGAVVHNLAAVA